MLKFEWNEAKAGANLRIHGVSFEMATTVLKDPLAIEWMDDRKDHREERFVVIGIARAFSLLYVAHTEREDFLRIISAHRATPKEQEEYVHQNA